jgi:hypothetical protein
MWLPQGAAVSRQREEGDYCRTNGNQYRTQADNAGIEQRFAQTFTTLMGLFNEVEQHDHMADNHANESDLKNLPV